MGQDFALSAGQFLPVPAEPSPEEDFLSQSFFSSHFFASVPDFAFDSSDFGFSAWAASAMDGVPGDRSGVTSSTCFSAAS